MPGVESSLGSLISQCGTMVAFVQRLYLLDNLHAAFVYDPCIPSVRCIRKSVSSKRKHCSFEERRCISQDESRLVNHWEERVDPAPESPKIALIVRVVDLVETEVNGRALRRRCGNQEIVQFVHEVPISRREHRLRAECAKRELLVRHMSAI